MSRTRKNHYVPEWYQRGFLAQNTNNYHYLDLKPDAKKLKDGRVIKLNSRWLYSPSSCFFQTDLYTTFFGKYINDDIEKYFFGAIDDKGARAIRAFISDDPVLWHKHFSDFFSYMDTQKIRSPKGLDWINSNYPELNKVDLLLEMQSLRDTYSTLWTECVRELVFASESEIKFIVTDHPITVYNRAIPPSSDKCVYPNDPSIALKGTQTIFALDKNHCMILTNLEFAKNPLIDTATDKRTFPRMIRQSLTRTDAFIRQRKLSELEVASINFILKSRAKRYIAAEKEEWLYPENVITGDWANVGNVLNPPDNKLHEFGGEIIVGYKDGQSYWQDEHGRTTPDNPYLKRDDIDYRPGPNDACGCGSGKLYKYCCLSLPKNKRPAWDVLGIRERSLILYRAIYDILGFNDGKNWDNVRRELSNEQVVRIHEVYRSLWPTSTDLYSLLPRPDNTLRALYSGILDPRITSAVISGASPYFDEILVMYPITHPDGVNKDFSPVENPHHHKQNTLKNVLLLLELEPLVRAGAVILIPDPCDLDPILRQQVMHMADARNPSVNSDSNDFTRMHKLAKNDFAHSIYLLPSESKKRMILEAFPDMSEEAITRQINYMDKLGKDDPLLLLQDDLYLKGGQYNISHLSPNFEVTLLLAQTTGSIVLTDSDTRKSEFMLARRRSHLNTVDLWTEFTNSVHEGKAKYSIDAMFNAQLFQDHGHRMFKEQLRTIYQYISAGKQLRGRKQVKKLINSVKNSIKSANRKYPKDIPILKVSLQIEIPSGGFTETNVSRLLIKQGSENHISSVPILIYMEYKDFLIKN